MENKEARILQIENNCTEEIRSLLKENILGTPGQSMVYRQLRTADKLDHIPQAYFAQIKKNSNVISTCCFCKRQIGKSTFFYVRYFSFKQSLRSVGHAVNRKSRPSIIRSEIQSLLSGSGLTDENATFYAYLDTKNIRSARLCYEFGFEQIRTFSTLTFSRFFPKVFTDCEKATIDDFAEIRSLLRKKYDQYAFYMEENLFYEGNYFVKRNEEGNIIAGIQANTEQWEIHELAGSMGKALLKIASRLPFLNRLINRNFRFVAFDYCFGSKEDLEMLMESTLSIHGMYSGLMALDNKSDLYCEIKAIRLGLLNRLKKEVQATVIAKNTQNNPSDLAILRQQPSFISTLDLT